MKRSLIAFGFAMLLTACGRSAIPGAAFSPQMAAPAAPATETAKKQQHVYWTLFAGSTAPQVQIASVPLRSKSKATSIYYNAHNTMLQSSGMHVDASGRLWILVFGPYSGNPGSVLVFTLPLTAKSAPKYAFVLSGTDDPDHLTFDKSGNLWINSHANSSVLEYTGPFNQSGTLSPAKTLTMGLQRPSGIAIDKSGNVYVANIDSTGKNSIAVFKAPVSNKKPYFLNGLSAPGGLSFDSHGNLYASLNGVNSSAIVRYNSSNLKSGAKPSIVDKTKLTGGVYEADLALTAAGDLYFANCGSHASIFVYPTSTKAFTSKLAPSVNYKDSEMTAAGCAWGIAIK